MTNQTALTKKDVLIKELEGKIFSGIAGAREGSRSLALFVDNDEPSQKNKLELYQMHHRQDCSEDVWLADITGDINDLIDSPIISAQELPDEAASFPPFDGYGHSFTWTFYEIGTRKGKVTFRWYGSSNGYYSEEVNIQHIKED